MRLKVAKWGNSLAVRLPKVAVTSLGASEGSELDLQVYGGKVELAPVKPDVYSLDWIVAEMKRLGPEHEPETVDWGPDVGSEIIDDAYSRGEISRPPSLDEARRG